MPISYVESQLWRDEFQKISTRLTIQPTQEFVMKSIHSQMIYNLKMHPKRRKITPLGCGKGVGKPEKRLPRPSPPAKPPVIIILPLTLPILQHLCRLPNFLSHSLHVLLFLPADRLSLLCRLAAHLVRVDLDTALFRCGADLVLGCRGGDAKDAVVVWPLGAAGGRWGRLAVVGGSRRRRAAVVRGARGRRRVAAIRGAWRR